MENDDDDDNDNNEDIKIGLLDDFNNLIIILTQDQSF